MKEIKDTRKEDVKKEWKKTEKKEKQRRINVETSEENRRRNGW
jgi:hypothetical protein